MNWRERFSKIRVKKIGDIKVGFLYLFSYDKCAKYYVKVLEIMNTRKFLGTFWREKYGKDMKKVDKGNLTESLSYNKIRLVERETYRLGVFNG